MPKILAIDTSSEIASVAISNNGKVFFAHGEEKLNHLKSIINLVDKVLIDSQLQIDDVTAVAISEGPGSFTGIRIGATVGKTIAQQKNIPIISVPTLLAYAYIHKVSDTLICPMLDARRGQVYAAAYKWQNGTCKEIIKAAAYDKDEFLNLVEWGLASHHLASVPPPQIIFMGSGTPDAVQGVPPNTHIILHKHPSPLIECICEIAKEMYSSNKVTDYLSFKPVYMRKAEAERKLHDNS